MKIFFATGLLIAVLMCTILTEIPAAAELPKAADIQVSQLISHSLSVGDIVEFGCYPQNEYGSDRPIKWRVLTIENGKALLLSEYGLDCVPYHGQFSAVTWESCELRKWSNDYFYNRAFSAREKKKIAEVRIRNANNPKYWTNSGRDTSDRVFCLSIDEVNMYFPADGERGGRSVNDSRYRKPTPHAINKGADVYKYKEKDKWAVPAYDGNCYYWLRSPASGTYSSNGSKTASYVNYRGSVDEVGYIVHHKNVAFVPALWVSLP